MQIGQQVTGIGWAQLDTMLQAGFVHEQIALDPA
jgi:hypothetical protein